MSNEDDLGDDLEVGITEVPDIDALDEDDVDLGDGTNSMVYELKFSRENIQFMVDGAIVKKVPKTAIKSPYNLAEPTTCINMASLFRRQGLDAVLKEYIIAE